MSQHQATSSYLWIIIFMKLSTQSPFLAQHTWYVVGFLGHLRGDACDGGTGAEAEERSPCPWSRRSGVLAGRSFDHPQFILVLHGHDYPVTVALTKGQSQVTGVTYKAVLAASPVLAGLA